MLLPQRLLFVCLLSILPAAAIAQAQAWLQIEARPTLAQAEERARAYADVLPDVTGFRLSSGWYAIALGPYATDAAGVRLAQLRAQRLVPGDSFIADGTRYRDQFWPGDSLTPQVTEPIVLTPPEPGEETVQEARAGERSLTREDRAEIQVALQWDGFYNGAIDASFGPGTRRAMADWQSMNGYEATGVLTTRQRYEVLEPMRAARRSLGLDTVRDADAGIEMALPLGLVRFDRHEAPFAHYSPATDDGVRALMISQTGDAATLAGLYDVMQTLEIVPLEGERELSRRSFVLTGRNDDIVSYTYAELDDGAVKGFTLVWPTGDERRRRLALEAMQASFRTDEGVLPDTAGRSSPSVDLMAGLRIRAPERTRSGFYVDGRGRVLTTAAAVADCERITLDDDLEAAVVTVDTAQGLALLEPAQSLAPIEVAQLATDMPGLQSEIAVSGYSFGGLLGSPTMTFGALTDVRGLDGNTAVERLSLAAKDGDAGGPVFDSAGNVLGILLDRAESDRVLPDDVAFAVDAAVIATFLSENGVSVGASDAGEALHPADLARRGADMTVLVSCWK